MMYKIFLIGLLGIFLFESCYDDKGNYSYRAINEITVKHDFFGDTVLRMYSFVDTLRVFLKFQQPLTMIPIITSMNG